MKPESFKRLVQPIINRVISLATRSQVVSVDSSKDIYVVLSNVRGKPSPEQIPMMQNFGFASVPPSGSDQLRVHLSSDPDNPLIIASHHAPSQPTDLVPGNSAIFDDAGQYMKLKVDGLHIFTPDKDINIKAPGGKVNVESPTVNVTASTEVNVTAPIAKFSGAAIFQGIVTALGFQTLAGLVLESHKHNENNILNGPTDGPIN